MCLVGLVGPATARPIGDGNPATTDRIPVEDPTAATVTLAQARFDPGTADHVVLATIAGFADSLAAAPLLGAGPLLLTDPGQLPAAVGEEILRLVGTTGRVIVLGGEAAVSGVVTDQLEARGHEVVRLAGPDRIATAIAVVEWLAGRVGAGRVVALARAYGDGSAGWADSITGSGWSANTGTPLLITPTGELDQRVADLLGRLGTETVIVLGGPAAIADSVTARLPDPRRVHGPDRTTTAVAVAEQLWGPAAGYVLINGSRDDGWAIGLAAAGLSADADFPLLLVDTDQLPDPARLKVGTGCGTGAPQLETIVIGSATLVGDAVIGAVDSQDGGECPAPPVVLDGNGLGVVALGTPADAAVAALTSALGPPSYVSEEMFPFCEPSGQGRGRIYEWGNLTVYINDPTATPSYPGYPGNPAGNGQPYFWGGLYGGFAYDPATDTVFRRPDPWGFTTDRGVGLDATNAEVRAAYPDGTFHTGYPDSYPPPSWDLPGQLSTFMSANHDSGTLQTFLFGGGCGE